MRVFSIGSDGEFTEYEQLPFKMDHEESVLEEWLESNPDGILEDGQILIIGRQVRTDLGACIDLLGVDREGNAVVIEFETGPHAAGRGRAGARVRRVRRSARCRRAGGHPPGV